MTLAVTGLVRGLALCMYGAEIAQLSNWNMFVARKVLLCVAYNIPWKDFQQLLGITALQREAAETFLAHQFQTRYHSAYDMVNNGASNPLPIVTALKEHMFAVSELLAAGLRQGTLRDDAGVVYLMSQLATVLGFSSSPLVSEEFSRATQFLNRLLADPMSVVNNDLRASGLADLIGPC